MKLNLILITIFSIFLLGCGKESSNNTNQKGYIPTEYNNPNPSQITILAIGQSNMANSGTGLDYTSKYGTIRIDSNYNYVVAKSPNSLNVLASGTGSNFLPLLGDMLIENGIYGNVTYANLAVNGSCMIEWTPAQTTFNFQKIERVSRQGFEFTHILFHQGECDTEQFFNTSKEDYKRYFLQMLQGIRDLGINAPIYVARTSYVFGITDDRIIQAQNELIQQYPDILEGPYTDIMGSEYRHDDVHFNRDGLINHALMWSQLIH